MQLHILLTLPPPSQIRNFPSLWIRMCEKKRQNNRTMGLWKEKQSKISDFPEEKQERWLYLNMANIHGQNTLPLPLSPVLPPLVLPPFNIGG